MPAETTRIPTQGHDAPMGAAAYIAALAYPQRVEWAKRDRFLSAVRRDLSIRYVKKTREKSRIRPENLNRRPRIKNQFNKVEDRLAKARFPAVAMFERIRMTHILSALSNIPSAQRVGFEIRGRFDAVGPDAVAREFVSKHYSRHALWDDKAKKQNRSHVLGRVWASSKPVLHLAVILREIIEGRSSGNDRATLLDLIWDPAWLDLAVKRAEDLRREISSGHWAEILSIDENATVSLIPD